MRPLFPGGTATSPNCSATALELTWSAGVYVSLTSHNFALAQRMVQKLRVSQ